MNDLDARAYLMALPGVGPKTAEIVLSFALGRPANRTRKDAAARKIKMDVQASSSLVESASPDLPGGQQAQSCLKQIVLMHARHGNGRLDKYGQMEHER